MVERQGDYDFLHHPPSRHYSPSKTGTVNNIM